MKSYRKALFSLTALCITLICAFLLIGQVQASPAAPVDFTVTQPDGTTFIARQWGDEWNNGVETIEGYSITQQADGWWVYAAPQADGLLGPALFENQPRRVGIDSPEGLALHLRATVVNENPNSPAAMGITSPSLESPEAPTLTTVRTLVLLADFNNTTPVYGATSFQSLMFGTGTGSVRDFYRDTSFNNMDIVPAQETCGTANDGITNWYELAYAHPNPVSTGTANRDIVKNVLIANDGCINFATFDTNGNNYIETSELAIVVVVAGYERSFSSFYSPSIWAHQSWLTWATGGAPQLDGKWIGEYGHGNYAQFGEHHGTHQATIGIMAHEFGHVINWPDLYDTDLTSEGVGNWSIMGGGSWNGVTNYGDSPAMADAWLKWYQGWITPTVVSGTLSNQAIAQAETNATAFLMRPNPGGVDWRFIDHSGTGEYFLVENRQYSGYDAGLPGCGLLIWHIDETVTEDNSANGDETHALVWLEQADGLNELAGGTGDRGDTGDPYPGSTSKYNFKYNSVPNSRLYSSIDSQVAVHVDSTTCGASMQADLMYPAPINVNLYLPFVKRALPATSGTIPNGNFESGHANWTEYSTNSGYAVIVKGFAPTSVTPHGGSWGVWLGGVEGYDPYIKYIQQSVFVGSLNPYLSFYQWSASEDICDYDYAYVSINGTFIYSRDLCTDTDTGGWVRSSLNLSSYVGQTVTLQFLVVTDDIWNSNWFIDDVAFSTTAAPPLEVEEIFPFDPNNLLPQEEVQ